MDDIESKSIPPSDLLELQKSEFEDLNKAYNEEIKIRRKREFILVIICLIALLYTYPVKSFESNPIIEIPAISLKIPIKDAIAVFPTLIAAIYLVFLSSAKTQIRLQSSRSISWGLLENYKHSGILKPVDLRLISGSTFDNFYLFLPTPLHMRYYSDSYVSELSSAIVSIFVGVIFSLLPFVITIFITIKSNSLINNTYLLIWNIITISTMLLALLSSISFKNPLDEILKNLKTDS
jgi:hypothetical protein